MAKTGGGDGDQYFEATPSVSSAPRTVTLTLPDVNLELETDRGVFGHRGVDAGTKLLLLEAPHPEADHRVVDVGCGYGPIALTLAHRQPAAEIVAVDVNERARALTAANAARHGFDTVTVIAPDDPAADGPFDRIYSNPPIRIGKAALHELLTTWLDRLAPGGFAYLVVQRHLGSDSLARWLEEQGWPTRRAASRGGYRILEVSAR